jgi:class 3 adenylate cyclase
MGNGNAIIRGKSDLGAEEMPDDPNSQSSQILVRKLATILSADVAEFSRLMGEDEEQTLKTFRGHKKVFEALVATHRGRIFNTAGDAILAEFASAVEAVRCATDIQAALRTRNEQLAPSRQVRFRIGINLGDVMEQGQDLMGDGVNVAARLQTAAEPGERASPRQAGVSYTCARGGASGWAGPAGARFRWRAGRYP